MLCHVKDYLFLKLCNFEPCLCQFRFCCFGPIFEGLSILQEGLIQRPQQVSLFASI